MNQVTNHPPSTTNPSSLGALFSAQRAALATRGAPSHASRVEALSALSRMLRARQRALADAVFEDFGGRAREETLMLELLPLLDASGHARRSLARWMKPRRVAPTWFLLPARAYVIHQPKGVVGVIGT